MLEMKANPVSRCIGARDTPRTPKSIRSYFECLSSFLGDTFTTIGRFFAVPGAGRGSALVGVSNVSVVGCRRTPVRNMKRSKSASSS